MLALMVVDSLAFATGHEVYYCVGLTSSIGRAILE
jgi:hypothetical protein